MIVDDINKSKYQEGDRLFVCSSVFSFSRLLNPNIKSIDKPNSLAGDKREGIVCNIKCTFHLFDYLSLHIILPYAKTLQLSHYVTSKSKRYDTSKYKISDRAYTGNVATT